MIHKSVSPLSPSVSVILNNVEVDYTSIVGADLWLEENKHDLLVLKMAGVPPQLFNTYLNVPILFNLHSGPSRSQQFTGYVSHVEPMAQSNQGFVNNSPFQEVHLHCVGASYYMKSTKTENWVPPTLNNVVTTMSKRYGFSADFPKDTYVPTGLAQTSESDWSFLVKAVTRYGHRVSVHGTHIHVWDVYNATGRVASYHDLITPKNPAGPQPGTILQFDGFLGSLSSTGGSSLTAVSYLDNQGNSLKVTSNDVNTDSGLGSKFNSTFENATSITSQSFEEAQREVLRIKKENMPFSARALITAGAGIVPGGIVNIPNYGSQFDGLWYVKGVKHSLLHSHYTTELDLTKDSLYTTNLSIKPVTRFTNPPSPSLVGERWVASIRKVNEYV